MTRILYNWLYGITSIFILAVKTIIAKSEGCLNLPSSFIILYRYFRATYFCNVIFVVILSASEFLGEDTTF